MRMLDYPMAPAVLAIMRGPLAEASMRQSLIIGHGSFRIIFARPLSGSIMTVAVLLFLVPILKMVRRRLSLH